MPLAAGDGNGTALAQKEWRVGTKQYSIAELNEADLGYKYEKLAI